MAVEDDSPMEVDPPSVNGGKGVEEAKANGAESSGSSNTIYAPNFDLEQYASRYTGYTKIQRLLFIAHRSKALELDAYRLAIDSLKKGIDTETYKKVLKLVGGRLGEAYSYDAGWVDAADKRAAQIRERLESDLNGSKTNMIKESIRMGYTDMGDFFHARGNLDNALKNYVRTRDYCHITRHNIEMCLNVIKVSMDMKSFAHVSNYVSKAEHTPDLQDPVALSKLKAAAGLAQLSQQNYVGAARKFLECSSDHLCSSSSSSNAAGPDGGPTAATSSGSSSAPPTATSSSFSQVIAPEDVATYGGLCALATLDREELKTRVIESPSFKGFLELVPPMRELVFDFCNSRYGQCIKYLTDLRPELELDLHLASGGGVGDHDHVKTLYKKIRDRCLLQFFTPYLSVDLRRMASAFQVSVEELEEEASQLIMANQLQARIDSHNKTMHRRQVDRRDAGYLKVVGMGEDFLREVRSLLLRMSLLEHGVVVEAGGRGTGGGGRGGDNGGVFGGMGGDVMLGEGGAVDPEDLMMEAAVAAAAAASSSSSSGSSSGSSSRHQQHGSSVFSGGLGHYEENQQDAHEGGGTLLRDA